MRKSLYSPRVVLPDGIKEATIFIDNDRISKVELGKVIDNEYAFVDCGNDVIMPGLIDSHVHINEPGRTEWEGFDSATRAAAAGGITTLIDMPLNSSPVTTSAKAFKKKLTVAKSSLHVNCGFWGGLVPDSRGDLEALLKSGVLGIKVFLCHSGIEEFPNVNESDLRKALPIIKKANIPLLVHCELESDNSFEDLLKESPTSYGAYVKSRPKLWEDNAISLIIDLCRAFNVHCHIVHLSSANSLYQIDQAKNRGLPLTVETCPHYLFFESEKIPDGATEYKCAPPIRDKNNNDLLWKAVNDKLIDFIVTDHSPAPPQLKELDSGNFQKAWGGIAGLQLSLPVVWTKGKEKRLSIENICQLMSTNVANFLKMDHERGKIAKGYMADLVVWNPEEVFVVDKKNLHHRHKITPYMKCKLLGVVKKSFVSGHEVFDEGEFTELNKGQIILRDSP